MTSQINHSINYMPHIDGLRALAVIIIVLFHLDVVWFGGGFVGVDVFFVISGYLITKIIARQIEDKNFSITSFYARRIKRIFPALFVMLTVTSIVAVLFLGLTEYGDFFKSVRMASAQISNIFFAKDLEYFSVGHKTAPLLHTWSLGVEEQFYLLWPAVLLLFFKFKNNASRIILLGGLFFVSLGISEYLVRHDAMAAFYFLHSRAWEFAIGGAIALNKKVIIVKKYYLEGISIIGFLMIMLCAILYSGTNFPGLWAIIPTLGAAMIIFSLERSDGIIKKILSLKPIVFIGLMSYSVYLWHWPIIAFYKGYFGTDLNFILQISFALSSFVLGYLSYRYVEVPCRAINAKPYKVIIAGLGVIVLFVTLSNVLKKQSDADWRVTYKADEYVRKPHALDKICSVDGGAFNRDDCIIGPNKDKYEVILTGDSHASHYTPAVLEWAKDRGLTVRIFLRGACATWIQSDATRIKNGKVDKYCMDLTTALYDTLKNDKDIQYIFLGKVGPMADEDTKKSLAELKKFNKKIIFLGQPPRFKENPHVCQIKKSVLASKIFPLANANEDCLAFDLQWLENNQKESRNSIRPFLKELNIPYFDAYSIVKTPFDKEGNFMYLDDNHLNRYGGEHMAPYLTEFIEKQM